MKTALEILGTDFDSKAEVIASDGPPLGRPVGQVTYQLTVEQLEHFARRVRDEVLGRDLPWTVQQCLSWLADSADHLLRDHNCDRHGYESIGAARDAAMEHLTRLGLDDGSAEDSR